MPIKDEQWWRARQGDVNPCHYQDRALDFYANFLRRRAIMNVWPDEVGPGSSLLDVGCGDGKMTCWMGQMFEVITSGVDAILYDGVTKNVHSFCLGDGETLLSQFPARRFDLITAITSLPFMSNWRRCVWQMTQLSDRILVVENTQDPAPTWQSGLSYKEPITYRQLCSEMAFNGFAVHASVAVNVIDRALLLKTPGWSKWPVMVLSLVADLVLSPLTQPRDAKYTATLFIRSRS